jgi:hypothetical protein
MTPFLVKIEGQTPLLVNRFHEEAQAEASSGTHSRKERPSPEEDAESRLYKNEAGIYFPAENLRQSIITASGRHKIGRRSAAADVAAAIFIKPFALTLTGEWKTDSRAVVIPATRGRILRHRPIFEKWIIEFELEIEEDLIDKTLIRRIVDDAGNYCGLGDFRPARKGPHGRFLVMHWEEVKAR